MKSSILQSFCEHPWAILPGKLSILEEIALRHARGEKLDAQEVQARIHGGERPAARRVERVAVLPLFGTIFPRANLMTDVSGATSAEMFGKQLQALVDDPEIDAIVLDVDSPGGYAAGIDELSSLVYGLRGRKPMTAISNHTMASAAYWVASAADEVVVSPSGQVGSVGVFAVHQDYSKALENDGVKTTIIKQGRYKAEANPYEPLGEEARAAIQGSVDETYEAFIGALARNRNVEIDQAREGFGQGRMISARQAVSMGMADRIATLEDVLRGYLQNSPTKTVDSAQQQGSSDPARAELERQAHTLRERVTQILQGDPNA